jgi:hypothetical protein
VPKIEVPLKSPEELYEEALSKVEISQEVYGAKLDELN